jgi:FMN phosphatase YigB (HAD superfamily)
MNYMAVAVSFDWFDTLVAVERPSDPAAAVAAELRQLQVTVPHDWEELYRTAHREIEQGRAAPLDRHVRDALAGAGIDIERSVARRATRAAFAGSPSLRPGAREALAAARERGPVAVCSNCSVPGLVPASIAQTPLTVDVVVTSVDCGWRKPFAPIFRATADQLDAPLSALVHVGDDPRTDGGADRCGATTVCLEECSLRKVAEWFDEEVPAE